MWKHSLRFWVGRYGMGRSATKSQGKYQGILHCLESGHHVICYSFITFTLLPFMTRLVDTFCFSNHHHLCNLVLEDILGTQSATPIPFTTQCAPFLYTILQIFCFCTQLLTVSIIILETIQRWLAICRMWPWTLTYQKFLLCISSQGQDLYSHQKLNMYIYRFSSESGYRRWGRWWRQRRTPQYNH